MGTRLFLSVYILILYFLPSYSQDALSKNICSFDIDSMRLKMYTLTFNIQLQKFGDKGSHLEKLDDSLFNVVECDIEVERRVEIGDTVQYFLIFRRNNPSDEYKHFIGDTYVGIGYVKSTCVYYPMLGQSAFDVELSYYKNFFVKKEKEFIEYLRKYKGNLSHCVKQYAITKGIYNR